MATQPSLRATAQGKGEAIDVVVVAGTTNGFPNAAICVPAVVFGNGYFMTPVWGHCSGCCHRHASAAVAAKPCVKKERRSGKDSAS